MRAEPPRGLSWSFGSATCCINPGRKRKSKGVKAPLHSLQHLHHVHNEVKCKAETLAFRFPESTQREPILDGAERVAGTIVRRQLSWKAASRRPTKSSPVFLKITVRIVNTSVLAPGSVADQEAVLLRTFASTHTRFSERRRGSLSRLSIHPHPGASPACQNITVAGSRGRGRQGQAGCRCPSPRSSLRFQ